MRLTRRQREQRRIEEAELRRRVREPLDPAEPRTLGCGHLAPEVPAGKLAPPPSECEVCRREALARRDPVRAERRVGHPLEVTRATPGQLERAALYFERHPPAGIQPGSREEEEALARIEELREEEIARDERRSKRAGILVSSRIEGGVLVEYRAVGHGRIVRVTP